VFCYNGNMRSPLDLEECWLNLILAIIERAHRDTRPATPETIRREAAEFIQWLQAEAKA